MGLPAGRTIGAASGQMGREGCREGRGLEIDSWGSTFTLDPPMVLSWVEEGGRVMKNAKRAKERKERRDGGRRERRGWVIVTWNVRNVGVRENNRAILRRIAERVVREGWEIVLVSELKAEEEGVVWMGDQESEVVLIQSGRAGVVLRGKCLGEVD